VVYARPKIGERMLLAKDGWTRERKWRMAVWKLLCFQEAFFTSADLITDNGIVDPPFLLHFIRNGSGRDSCANERLGLSRALDGALTDSAGLRYFSPGFNDLCGFSRNGRKPKRGSPTNGA